MTGAASAKRILARAGLARAGLARAGLPGLAGTVLAGTVLAGTVLLAACSGSGEHHAHTESAGRPSPGHAGPGSRPSPGHAGPGGRPSPGHGEPAGAPSPTHIAQFLPPSSPAAVTTPPASPAGTTSEPVPAQPPIAAGPGPCSTGGLKLSVGQASGTAGSIYYPLVFTNVSGASCTMYGYPGVALVSAPGAAVVGAPAVRDPTFPPEVVTLTPGSQAHASLQVGVAANYPASDCKPATADWLQVFPPGEYAALYVSFTAQTCTGDVGDGSILGIFVVRPGTTGP
jgi:hypothetical protein